MMGKLIVPVLALALVGVGGWFLLSKDAPKKRAVPAVAVAQPVEAIPAEARSAPQPVKMPDRPRRAARPVVKNGLRRPNTRPAPSYVEGAKTATAAPSGQVAPARPIVPVNMEAVQDTVRRYYGNLPKSGALPSRVTLEELLPAEAIARLGAPADAQVTVLGPWPIDKREAFKEVLDLDRRYNSMLGVSWKQPDGSENRDYIELKAPESQLP